MELICGACSQPNAAHARYCATCGAPMDEVQACSPHSPVANFALIVAAVLSMMAASAAVGGASSERLSTIVRRDYSLSHEKSQTLFGLLRPRDVKVLAMAYDSNSSRDIAGKSTT